MKRTAIPKFQKLRFPDRLKEFREIWLPRLRMRYIVTEDEKKHIYTIKGTAYGIVVFYIKGNKCYLWRKSRWIKPGFEWIVKSLLKDGK